MGTITTANFKSMTETCDREVSEAQKIIAELEEELFTQEEYRKHITEVKTRIDAAIRDASSGMITNEFVSQYIDKIFVTIQDTDTARLDIKIFTGKNTEKWFNRLNARSKGRTGHTFKKMVESYENSIKNSK